MRVYLLIATVFLSLSLYGQESCRKELSFFPLWEKSINTGNAKYDRLRLDNLDEKTLKARNKVTEQIKSYLGPYKANLRLDRMRVISRTESKTQHFTYRYSVNIQGFKWGFEVSSSKSGKITSELPFPRIKKVVIDPCEAISRAEAQMHFEEAVGVKLTNNKGTLIWEVWQTGESLNAKESETGQKRSEHKVLSIDARNLEIYGSRKEVLKRY